MGTQEQREDPEGGGTGLLGTEGQRDMVVPGMGFPTKKKPLWFHHAVPSHAVKGLVLPRGRRVAMGKGFSGRRGRWGTHSEAPAVGLEMLGTFLPFMPFLLVPVAPLCRWPFPQNKHA